MHVCIYVQFNAEIFIGIQWVIALPFVMGKEAEYEISSRQGKMTVFSFPLIPPFDEFPGGTGRCLWYKILSQLWHEETALKWCDAVWPVWIWHYLLNCTRICEFDDAYTVPSFTGSKLCPTPWRTQRKHNKEILKQFSLPFAPVHAL